MWAIFAFLPVLLFLFCLFLLDSFKLVSTRWLLLALLWGLLSAVIAFYANTGLADLLDLQQQALTRYVAPVTEELLKLSFIFLMVARHRMGFMIDAAIYGFAVGAGFALAENFWYYLHLGEGFSVALAIVRGFGTAIMHGGVVAIAAMILVEGLQRKHHAAIAGGTGTLIAIVLHSAFNHLLFNPLVMTLLIILLLPLLFYAVFLYTTRQVRDWLEVAFSSEVEMLAMMRKGQFRNTRAGEYLASLKKHFSPETLVDMYWFFTLYLELSIKAKRNLLLRESGFPAMTEPGIKEKLSEMRVLRKKIGKAGQMALLPLVRMSQRELWELNQLS